jgi:hypothetical protein
MIYYIGLYSTDIMPASKEYLQCILNPWGEPATIADEFSMPTAAVKCRSVHQINTSDNGAALFVIQPWDLFNQFFQQATFTTGTNTIASFAQGTHPDVSTINSYYNQYRTVSVGVKAFYTGAEQSTAGVLGIVPLTGIIASTIATPTDLTAWTQMPWAKTVAAAAMTEPLCGVAHSFDRPFFHANTVQAYNAFPSLAVILLGAPVNSSLLRIEVQVNIEVLPKLTTSFQALATQPTAHDPSVMNTARKLTPVRVGTETMVTKATLIPSGKKRKSTAPSRYAPYPIRSRTGSARSYAPTGLLQVPNYRSQFAARVPSARRYTRRTPMRRVYA